MDIDRRFKIVLDRSGYRSEDLLQRIKSSLEKLRHIETSYEAVNNYERNRTEQSFDTIFTYHLTTQENQESAIAGLEDLINTLPVTLVTQSKRIKQVRVINKVEDTDVVYTCESKSIDDNILLSEVKIDDRIKKYLSYITEDVALTTEINKDSNIYEIVKRDNKQPVLYRDFPLIGSEKFYFPYVLNGFNFNPTERRNGLLLNSADLPSCISNREIINKAVDSVLKFNEWLIVHNATNKYLLASSRIPKPSEDYSENVALPWIKDLQVNWRKQLLQERLVETDNGTDLLVNLSVPAFTATATKEVNETFYNLLYGHYFGRGTLPVFKHLHEWLEVVRPEYEVWGTKLKYDKDDFLKDLSELQNLSNLTAKISKTQEETIAWLNKVYKFLVDQNMLSEFDNYAIIPNQRGDFKLLKDLYSDYTSRIPSILKNIYNSVNQDTATIQHILVDADIDATIWGNTLRLFSLKEMISQLNEYVKSVGKTILKNGKEICVRPTVAYKILSLFPKTEDSVVLQKRKTMYNFCCSYRYMDIYTEVDTTDYSLWKEADEYWFRNSYVKIETQKDAANFASKFFLQEKTTEEALKWLNDYLQFYRENSFGDFIKEKAVFPRQLTNSQENGKYTFRKLTELRFDNNVPEELKTLGDYAKNVAHEMDYCRQFLLHKFIKGYENHNPFSIKDLYEYVKKRFDESNMENREVIARHTISILAKHDNTDPMEKKLYDFCKIISDRTFPDIKYVENHTGFYWAFAQEFYIKYICKRIAESVNLDGLRKLNACFTGKEDNELILWIDSLIEFLHSYKAKTYWPIIADKEKGYGIWLNQNNNFCKFRDVRKDENIPEELKEVAASNSHVNYDFKENLFTIVSHYSSYLETEPMTLTEIAKYIDTKIREYDGNKQDKDFRALVFAVNRLCNSVNGLEDRMEYFKENKNSFLVWALGKGETMDFVGAIVQQGDEKIKEVKKFLEDNSLDDLKSINDLQKENQQLKEENQKLRESLHVPQHSAIMGGSDSDGVDELERPEWNESARKKVKEKLESDGYKFTKGIGEYSDIPGVIDPNGKPVHLVVKSCRLGKLFINPMEWGTLLKPNAMLWVFDGAVISPLHLRALIRDQDEIVLKMNTKNLDDVSRVSKFAQILKYFKQVHFDFNSVRPTTISSTYKEYAFDDRPMDEKPEEDEYE